MKVRPTILRILRATFPCLMTFVLCSACGPSLGKSYDLYEAENTARYISVQHNETKKDGYHKVHVCLEPTGPANKLDEINIELSAQGTYAGATVGGSMSVDTKQTLGQIYTVTEIMQLGHAAFYRLCEAVGNGDVDKSEYGKYFDKIFVGTQNLLRVQIEANKQKQLATARALKAELAARVETLEERIRKAEVDKRQADANIAELKDKLKNLKASDPRAEALKTNIRENVFVAEEKESKLFNWQEKLDNAAAQMASLNRAEVSLIEALAEPPTDPVLPPETPLAADSPEPNGE